MSPATLPPIWFDEGNTGVVGQLLLNAFEQRFGLRLVERDSQRPVVVAGVAARVDTWDCVRSKVASFSFSASELLLHQFAQRVVADLLREGQLDASAADQRIRRRRRRPSASEDARRRRRGLGVPRRAFREPSRPEPRVWAALGFDSAALLGRRFSLAGCSSAWSRAGAASAACLSTAAISTERGPTIADDCGATPARAASALGGALSAAGALVGRASLLGVVSPAPLGRVGRFRPRPAFSAAGSRRLGCFGRWLPAFAWLGAGRRFGLDLGQLAEAHAVGLQLARELLLQQRPARP